MIGDDRDKRRQIGKLTALAALLTLTLAHPSAACDDEDTPSPYHGSGRRDLQTEVKV